MARSHRKYTGLDVGPMRMSLNTLWEAFDRYQRSQKRAEPHISVANEPSAGIHDDGLACLELGELAFEPLEIVFADGARVEGIGFEGRDGNQFVGGDNLFRLAIYLFFRISIISEQRPVELPHAWTIIRPLR